AKVSEATVSLVLNQKTNVREETRQRVLKAIQELNYHPKRAARGLATRKSGNIGFILTDDHFSRAEPFYTKIFLGTEFEARKHNYYVLLTTVSKTFSADEIPRFLLEKNVDGVILAGHVPVKLVDYIQKQELPVVLVDFNVPRSRVSTVLIDNERGAYEAVKHLIHHGHQLIAFIGGDISHPSISERLQGYRRALEENKIGFNPAHCITDEIYTGSEDGYKAACKLLAVTPRPTAIFAANDAMAIGAIKCLKEHGLRVPEDVAVIGFDDIEDDFHVEPHLTTMRVFKEELGALAVRRIVEMIETTNPSITTNHVPVELVVRESCGTHQKL
ncbi:MAG: LacI family transcriptional regulator, partial [candidate division KSB1 bacterium]|nr:LacI family transcriptional regulator [candidate division KSB1 bacterium]